MLQRDFIYKSFLKQELVLYDEDIAWKLTNEANPRELQLNETLYTKGDEANFIYFVLDGSCKLVDGNKVLAVIEKGKSLGEFPLLGESRTYAVTAVAGEKSVLAQVSYSDFRDIAEIHSRIWEMMSAKLAKRLNEPLGKDATRDHLIILVHGIRTFANWQPKLKAVLEKAGLKVRPTNFDYFDLISFLAPLKYFRRKKIDDVLNQLRQARSEYPDAKISILAHSFGSYIVAEILADEPDIIVHRLVFCGSIVPSDHRFVKQLGDRIRTRVVNDVGSRDFWPALANSVTIGYGHTGTYGFRCRGVDDRWFEGLKHNDFLKPDFCRKNWVPFFKDGRLDSTDATHRAGEDGDIGIESPPLWLQALSVPFFKIKVVVPFLVLGALIWWKWNYLTQLLKLT